MGNLVPDRIIMFSGGLTSYEAARRTIQEYPKDRVRLWFADTKMEDEDLYRFNTEVEKSLGIEIEVLDQGMDVWETFTKHRFLGNSRIDPCSKYLKRVPLRKFLESEYPDPEDVVIILGMDDIEDCDRIKRSASYWKPYNVDFPLTRGTPSFKHNIVEELRAIGIEPPRLYEMGFRHNNCGGFCVKAGQGQFAHLLETMPDRFAYHENKEQEFRDWIGKDVAILKRMRQGITKPFTLKELREAHEAGETFRYDIFGGGAACNCMGDLDEVEKS